MRTKHLNTVNYNLPRFFLLIAMSLAKCLSCRDCRNLVEKPVPRCPQKSVTFTGEADMQKTAKGCYAFGESKRDKEPNDEFMQPPALLNYA